MLILLYNEMDTTDIPEFEKIRTFLESGDFRSAGVKKIGNNLYRARLNKADRLLFTLYRSQRETVILVLEHIKNHAYEKSRFLRRGVKVKQTLIPSVRDIDPDTLDTLPHLEQQKSRFHLLQKPITFDPTQQQIYDHSLPVIIIGTAGSGKTVLLLEKMKRLRGKLLYVTQSSYLAKHSQALYHAHQYHPPHQTASFLSFQNFLESIALPPGKAVTMEDFKQWFAKHLNATPIKDVHALHEEFKGVITGTHTHTAYLSREAYMALGIKESIFIGNQREAVYDLFTRYLHYLQEQQVYDLNLLSFEYLSLIEKNYDYVIVDEVQDMSPIQLQLVLSSLHQQDHFMFCGDANQVVYPNFFSWAKIKALFFQNTSQPTARLTQILNTNYRNSARVTHIANKLLRMKNWRFGSIDKETHHEMQSTEYHNGQLVFLAAEQQTLAEINQKTQHSKDFAVIVLYDELKPQASRYFQTPLVFSIQECKGLEYENVILFNMVSSASDHFLDISQGVTSTILNTPMRYARNKDKADKSLEKFKFFVNALFVAVTRAQRNLYWIEEQTQHPLLKLLHDEEVQHSTDTIVYQTSSEEEWQQEASKLEQQGKTEQAERIRRCILRQQSPPWEVIAGDKIDHLFASALEENDKKAKLLLFEYALVYEDHQARNALIHINFSPAFHPEDGKKQLLIKYFMMYQQEQLDAIQRQMGRYGVDFRNPFNQTPLMIGAWLGSAAVIRLATSLHADPWLANNRGFNAFQIAMEQACLHDNYARQQLPAIYDLLKPATFGIRLNDQLITLEQQQVEYFLVNLMIALFYRILPENMLFTNGAFSAANLTQAIQHWPPSVLPEKYHDPDFIHHIIANNPDLFLPVNTQHFILNPNIMLKAEGEWLYVYDILLFDDLSISYQNDPDTQTNLLYQDLLLEKIELYKQQLGIALQNPEHPLNSTK